jgi:NitT/TauT family transport system substrate-binding protein
VVSQNNAVYIANSNDVWGPAAPDCVINSTDTYVGKNKELLIAYQKVLAASAKDFFDDFDAAIKDLQPIYGAPKEILEVALRRQAPNPVIGDAGAAGIRNGVKYLIELGYLKTNVANEVLDLKYQPV